MTLKHSGFHSDISTPTLVTISLFQVNIPYKDKYQYTLIQLSKSDIYDTITLMFP